MEWCWPEREPPPRFDLKSPAFVGRSSSESSRHYWPLRLPGLGKPALRNRRDRRYHSVSTRAGAATSRRRVRYGERPSRFPVMHPAVLARRDQIVDMHVPQGGAVPLLVLAEEASELPHLGDFGAVEAEAAGDPGEVAAAVGRVARVAARRAEFVRLGAIAAVIQDADQHLNTVAAEGLQFLDVLVEAAVAVDQQHFVLPRATATPIAADSPEPIAPKSIGT